MNGRLNIKGFHANLAPINFEVDRGPLHVRGELPCGLAGVLVRNGPNPRFNSSIHAACWRHTSVPDPHAFRQR